MKKTLAFMLAMLCIFTAIPPIAIGATDQDQVPQIITNDDMDEETSYELGDLNLDGKVNMDDTTALMRHVLKAESITDEKALELCEVTGDDAINMDDVTKLMRFVLKAIDKLDPHTWQEATCTQAMTCSDCGKTKGSPLGHSYTIATQHMEDDISNVQLVCERCGGDGQTYSNALHISEKNALYLMQVATDFSFKVVCDQGLSYVQENVKVVERFYSELYEEQLSQIAIELNITEIDSNLYLVAPKNEYEMAESYTAILSEDLCFEDYPGTTLHFSTPSDEGKNEIEYNEDIYFLKNLTDTSYTLAFNEETTTYLLTLSGENMVSEELVEKILVVGECRSAEELKNTTGETVIGKVDLVYSTNGTTMLVLSAPSLLDVYSKLDIVNSTANELSEVLCTEEYETQLLYSLMESESFAEALTTTTIAAENYANANGLKAGKGIFDLSNFKITPVTTKSESGQPWVEGKVTIEYNHSIPLKNGDADYGSIGFKLKFVVTVHFSFEKTVADFRIAPDGFFSLDVVLNLELDILQTTTVDFTLDITLSVQDPNNEEVLYIVSKTPKIHEYTCIHCESLRKDTSNLYTLKEIQEMFPSGYTEYECSWCKPFTMDTSKFALNVESKVLHCGNCTHLDLSTKAEFRIYKMYPVGVPHTDCEHCQPGSHLNKGDLEKYLEESMQDSSYSAILEKIKNTLSDKLKGDGESKINRNRPITKLPIAQVLEVAVYLQPKFDFDLNASLHLDYQSENKCMYMVRSGLKNGDFYIQTTQKTYDNAEQQNWDLEIKGEAEAKIGVMTEATISFVGMSKFVYVGMFAEAGAYAKLNGILHANSNEENYYAAYTEAGIYLDVDFTYALQPFVKDDSISIIDDLHIPLFKGGDQKAYYAFTDPEAEITVTEDTKLSDTLLSVKYYDLTKMQSKEGTLSWQDNDQYSFDYLFIDSKGYVVKYCKVENGNLIISDDAPYEFTVTMYVSIMDENLPSDLFSYLFTPNKNGAAFFLGDLKVRITKKMFTPYSTKWLEWLTTEYSVSSKTYPMISDHGVFNSKYHAYNSGAYYDPDESYNASPWELWPYIGDDSRFHLCITVNPSELAYDDYIGTAEYPYIWKTYYRLDGTDDEYKSVTGNPWSVGFDYHDDNTIYRYNLMDYGMERPEVGQSYHMIFFIYDQKGEMVGWFDNHIEWTDSSQAYYVDAVKYGFVIDRSGLGIPAPDPKPEGVGKWKFRDGVLTLYGDGSFRGKDSTTPSSVTSFPWYPYREHIIEIVVEDSITSLGPRAFSKYPNLKKITFGKGITVLEQDLFSYCRKLKEITFNAVITSISQGVVYETNNISTIYLVQSKKSFVELSRNFNYNISFEDESITWVEM